ncbi:hypothetical protein PVAP13_5KG163314 [Panicum virgatum]|uniref:Uncharacterized protein n=1 Tax=Panicum virgatum TaxID=38727 RepID=A0A8T0SIR7_PANVG|nr:hypothetical protein PVAP13_5KG163314 [Panicum virgatum]
MEASSKHHCPAPVASLFCGGLKDVCRLSLPEGPALTLLIMPRCQLHLTQVLTQNRLIEDTDHEGLTAEVFGWSRHYRLGTNGLSSIVPKS